MEGVASPIMPDSPTGPPLASSCHEWGGVPSVSRAGTLASLGDPWQLAVATAAVDYLVRHPDARPLPGKPCRPGTRRPTETGSAVAL